MIENDLLWLESIIKQRLAEVQTGKFADLPAPQPSDTESFYARFVAENMLQTIDKLLLVLTLSPMLKAGFLDAAIKQNIAADGDHPELGGQRSAGFRGLLPTAETFLFLVAGNNLAHRLEIWHWLRSQSVLYKKQIVEVQKPQNEGEPMQSGILKIDEARAEEILYGDAAPPAFSMEFPARKLFTTLQWEDLALTTQTATELNELKQWLETRDSIADWGISRYVKKGYRALFYGPPGTGKTLAATLLGKHTGTEVFLVDLSMVVSKYIGETEKNLAALFNKARNKNWILFFDEADALFGKRTSVRDAHDKYANQEVAYLLQRVEDFPGLVILASNLKGNIDEAFLRRFQSVIHFPMPGPKERFLLWQKAFVAVPNPPETKLLQAFARKFELTGSNIVNAAHFACLRAAAEGKGIAETDLLTGINRELKKEGKVI